MLGVLQGPGTAQINHSEMHIAEVQVSTNIPTWCSALTESHHLMGLGEVSLLPSAAGHILALQK